MPPSRLTLPAQPSVRQPRPRRVRRAVIDDPVALAATGRFEAASPHGAGRFRLEALVARGRARHGVRTSGHLPLLLALHGPGAGPVGAIGIRAAKAGYGLAVEARLDASVSELLGAHVGVPVHCDQIAELGEITPLVPGARRALLVLAGRALAGNGRSWAVFEAGVRDRNALRRLGVPVVELAPARGRDGAVVAVRAGDLARCVTRSRGRDSTS